MQPAGVDAFGHKMLTSRRRYLENLVRDRLGTCRVRFVRTGCRSDVRFAGLETDA
ncbi:MAG: hypothetical protein ACLTTO_04670 [Lachnospiraceae bacterium]